MKREQIYSVMSAAAGITPAQARAAFDELIVRTLLELIETGKAVMPGLVELYAVTTPARKRRNPSNGTTFVCPERTLTRARVLPATRKVFMMKGTPV